MSNDPSQTHETTRSTRAARLRALHVIGEPLVLVNVWDLPSARAVVAAGGQAIATTSVATAAQFGIADDNSAPPDAFFDGVGFITAGVDVPVTVDSSGGFGLAPADLVGRLARAGAVGANIEDSDHSGGGQFEAGAHAERLAAYRAAAGDDLVINARVDSIIRSGGEPADALDDVIARGRRYLDAGADCLYPIGLSDPEMIRRVVDQLGAPVNVNANPAVALADQAAAGAARLSIGPMAFRTMLAQLQERATRLLGGDSSAFFG
jgi:2-methylisocitrate lyase-like PEP mutase family enzyme